MSKKNCSNKLFAFLFVSLFCLGASITTLANSKRFTLTTGAWGAWGPSSEGVYKSDKNNGNFQRISQDAWFDVYADAYYDGKRASNSYYNLNKDYSSDGKVWFSYVGGQNSAFYGRYISCRVSSSNFDPNSGNVTLEFEP